MNYVKFGDSVQVIRSGYRGLPATFFSWPRNGRLTACVVIHGKKHCLHIVSLVFIESSESATNDSNKQKKREGENGGDIPPPTLSEESHATSDQSSDVAGFTDSFKAMSLHLATCVDCMNNLNEQLLVVEAERSALAQQVADLSTSNNDVLNDNETD